MKKKAELTSEQLAWLRQAYKDRVRPDLMAAHLGFHVDTIKRLLDRHGIHVALSSKHITTDQPEPTWTRPCMCCKSTEPRPKSQYICTPCKTLTKRLHAVHESYHVL